MMPVSTKLTLLVLALPVFSIATGFIVGFYFYKESLDASAFFTAISSLLSAILVNLLVWERLRDTLFKKLEYLHKNFLFKLYLNFKNLNLFWNQDETKRLKVDLDKYGKFMSLSIYPRGFLNIMDEFLSVHGESSKRLEKIIELAGKQTTKPNLYRNAIFDYLELKPGERSTYTPEEEEQCRKIAQNIEKENPELVAEIRSFLEKARQLRENIFNQLEDFLKRNNLSLESEPSSIPYHY